MKKILLIVSIIMTTLNVSAQNFDEIDLVGSWFVVEISGTLPGSIKSFGQMDLGDGLYRVWEDEPYAQQTSGMITNLVYHDEYENADVTDNERIRSFFISNNNKLHIGLGDDYSLSFIIEELTSTTLKIKTFDGKGSLSLEKTSSPQSISQPTDNGIAYDKSYNIIGQQADKTTQGIVIHGKRKQLVK